MTRSIKHDLKLLSGVMRRLDPRIQWGITKKSLHRDATKLDSAFTEE